MKHNRFYRVWADVDLDAIRSNIAAIKKNLRPGVKACAVVKADGYGHGAIGVAQAVRDLVDFYAVTTIDEAMELRANSIDKPILILGYVHSSSAETAVLNDIRLTVYNLPMAQAISETAVRTGQTAHIHIKIDTGMSRIGFRPDEEALETICRIQELKGIHIEGIFTHFANADDETPDNALMQLARFKDFLSLLEGRGIRIPIRHCSNSAASTYIREADMDMVRMGASMYGLYPSQYVNQIRLHPALSLKSHVVMVKTIPAGTSVGYGSTWTAEKDSIIATIPVGYADGYNRALSNTGYVLIKGQRFPIVGKVCMDQLMTDVSADPSIQEGDEVVLIGRSGDLEITTEEIAELAGTFNYEFVCGLSRRVLIKYYRNHTYTGAKDEFEKYYEV